MKIRAIIFLFAVLAISFQFFPRPVFAVSTTAKCFCYQATDGATADSSAADANACKDICTKKTGNAGYIYAKDTSQYPSSNLRCFSKIDYCTNAEGTFDSGYQPPECMKGSHYCYPSDDLKTTLSVDIMGTKSVLNIAEYVDVLYRWLLGFSLVVTIVMMMIGGLRYVVGASSGDVTKAKEMIKKSVEGFVLLLFAYLILFTVNPQLIKLQVPKLPMIRQVQLLTGGEDCGSLRDKGYTIDYDNATKGHYQKGFCGTIASVTKDPSGADVLEGTTCVYTACTGTGDTACGKDTGQHSYTSMCVGAGSDYRCVRCGQITPGNSCNITPSSGLCGSLDAYDPFVGGSTTTYSQYNVCGYSHSPTMVSSVTGVTAASVGAAVTGGIVAAWYTSTVASAAMTGTCTDMTITCSNIATCEAYDGVKVYNSIVQAGQELDDLNYPSFGSPDIASICAQDPCGAGAKTGKKCTFEEGTAESNCVGK